MLSKTNCHTVTTVTTVTVCPFREAKKNKPALCNEGTIVLHSAKIMFSILNNSPPPQNGTICGADAVSLHCRSISN